MIAPRARRRKPALTLAAAAFAALSPALLRAQPAPPPKPSATRAPAAAATGLGELTAAPTGPGKRLAMVPQLVQIDDGHTRLTLSPDGRTLAAVHRRMIHLWDVATGALLRVIEYPGNASFFDVRYLPDSKRLLTANFDLRITTWDLETAAPIRALTGKPFGGQGLRFSEDGRRAVWLELDGYVRAADLTTTGPNGAPKILRAFGGTGPEGVTEAHTQKLPASGTLHWMSLSSRGSVLLLKRTSSPPEVYDVDSGKLLCKVDKKELAARKLELFPDGSRILALGYGMPTHILSAKTCAPVRELKPPKDPIHAIAITSDGRRALIATGKGVTLWDLERDEAVRTLAGAAPCNEIALSADGRVAALGGVASLEVWDLDAGARVRSLTEDKPAVASIRSVAIDATGKRAVSTTWEITSPTVAVWDLERLSLTASTPLEAGRSAHAVLAAGGTRAWTYSSFDDQLAAWNLSSFVAARAPTAASGVTIARTALFRGLKGDVQLAVAPSGAKALTIGARVVPPAAPLAGAPKGGSPPAIALESVLSVFDESGGAKMGAAVHPGAGSPLAMSPDGRYAATSQPIDGGKRMNVLLWDLTRGALLHTITSSTFYIWSAAFSPDGKAFAWNDIESGTLGVSRIHVVDVASGVETRLMKGRYAAAYGLSFSPDGKKIATTYDDHKTRVWSVDTGALLIEHALDGKAHRPENRAITFSPDGRHLLSGTGDGSIRLHRVDKPASVALIARGDDWLIYTEDGYFDASPKGGSLIGATSGLRPFKIDQLAVKNNRPDIILERMGLGTPELIEHYKARYRRRLLKLNMRDDPTSATFERAPTSRIEAVAPKGALADVSFEIEANGADLLRYNVFINDVPLFGALGKETSGRKRRVTEQIELGDGRNKIEVSALDAEGAESLRAFRVVTHKASAPGDLYYVGFGVSRYKNPRYNLGYPHKDVTDLGDVLKATKAGFKDVHVAAYVNEQVTVDAIRRAKEILRGAKVNDTVVLFVAGHGLHGAAPAADYYFVTHETDVKRLPETAASFELIEDLLQGIAPRKKLFLMDTCESGDDMGEGAAAGAGGAPQGAAGRGLRARTTRALALDVSDASAAKATSAPSRPRAAFFERDRYVYNDLSRRSGAIVLSSSRGSELSWELDELQNGVFTEEILLALTTGRADADKDGVVSVDELRRYVAGEVPKRTQSMQHPTVDRDNLEVSFGFPVVPEAAAIVTRADAPALAGEASAGGGGARSLRDLPAPPKTPAPQGCGCALPGEVGDESAASASLLLAIAAWLRRPRSRRAPRR